MTTNENTIKKFYTAFANLEANKMEECYSPEIKFRDPVFGLLQGNDVFDMWKMLVKNSNGNLKIEIEDIKAYEYIGSAKWTATYYFSKTNRKVTNVIQANFHFKDGLIIKHTDHFDLWKWTRQAFGLSGLLFGWTGFMQQKIQDKALLSLKKYQDSKL
ncbi:nuclear transport factor 2 family protein [Flavobacterium sp. K5-23]|uniref:nuclear transport factor 2 family protein n=1 Tax=Flavobacterium sp. K5-23 TaxID=2746225 RepID=UPI00200BB25A|nr:nuclear transport factor 2 family protein [Flavobacterium sp. K5-23]UQD57162.1 nuclear transport factor 2 family protein [Flavobacterium sp. K5-23]